MAAQSKPRRDGRSASQKPAKYRFAQNVDGEETVAEHVYRGYARDALHGGPAEDPDVVLDVPLLKVDSIHLELDDLQAHVSLRARVMELVNLNVGIDVQLGKVRLDIKGVEAQALLKVRLDHVAAVVDRVLTTVDRNPQLVESIGKAVRDVGSGAGRTLTESGEAVEAIGEGGGQAVDEIGHGAGQAVEAVGRGAGEAAGNLDQVGAGPGGGGLLSGDHSTRAKEAAKLTVKELGTAAQEKVKGIGEKRRHRKAERHHATEAALRAADEMGVDLDEVKGSGAEGRITVKDVRSAGSH